MNKLGYGFLALLFAQVIKNLHIHSQALIFTATAVYAAVYTFGFTDEQVLHFYWPEYIPNAHPFLAIF